MRRDQTDPLPFDLWLTELGKLAEASAQYRAEHEDRAVRRAYYLLELAPPAIRALGDPDLEESAIELLLEQGDALRAARLVVGSNAGVCLTRSGSAHRAELAFAGELIALGEGSSPALALVGAWAGLFRKAPQRALARLSASR